MQQLLKRLFLILGILILTALLITFPKDALQASLRGITIWSEVVFPALLPFFIMAELLISLGAISIIGVLFEPLMRPLFNIPGTGSLALIMGLTSGYPTGAKITAKLREEGKLSREEAERLVSFTNASSPLFIFGAIAVGFFHDAKIGLLIAICHYGGNILLGIILRFLYKDPILHVRQARTEKNTYIKQIVHELQMFKESKVKPIGEQLGSAVYNSVQTLIIIGGFITLFSVVTTLLLKTKLLLLGSKIFELGLSMTNFPDVLSLPILTGLFEISIGVEFIAQYKEIGLLYPLMAVSFLLGFNGLSIQAQVASIVAHTDIRFMRYFYARLIHGGISCILTFFLYNAFFKYKDYIPTLLPSSGAENSFDYIYPFSGELGVVLTIISICMAIIYKMRRVTVEK